MYRLVRERKKLKKENGKTRKENGKTRKEKSIKKRKKKECLDTKVTNLRPHNGSTRKTNFAPTDDTSNFKMVHSIQLID